MRLIAVGKGGGRVSRLVKRAVGLPDEDLLADRPTRVEPSRQPKAHLWLSAPSDIEPPAPDGDPGNWAHRFSGQPRNSHGRAAAAPARGLWLAATPDFVTHVTINNNRQNPVDPWNLHANDLIQLELQDRFRDELGIYYERQEQAFTNLSDEELEEQGITEHKALELTKLARTFLIVDGEIDKLARFREVFEDERIYNQVFNESRLKCDLRKIALCYKIQFRLGRLSLDIVDKGANKYAYVLRSRNLLWALLCQAILNDQKLEERAEKFGRGLSLEAQYTDWLSTLATTRCRFILADLVTDKAYAAKTAEGNLASCELMPLISELWRLLTSAGDG